MENKKIYVDGVDVSGCKEYIWALSHVCNLVNGRTDKFECNYYPNCYFKQLARKTQECEGIKEECEALKLENKELYRILADLKEERKLKDKYKQECEELKKANQHIDTNRQCKGSKLKRIEELISDCETGYTDEFIQKIYGIIQEPEPTVNDYSITDRYRKALEEIEKEVHSLGSLIIIQDIINKAKGEGDEDT